jgi:hypothetical protein
MKKFIILILLLTSLSLSAQDKYEITEKDYQNNEVEMADFMRSNGKIYVVVGVVMIIFTGLIIFMVNTERKVSKLEREFFERKG